MKEVESETILTKFIETRKSLGMKGKLKMKPLLGSLHSSFSKLLHLFILLSYNILNKFNRDLIEYKKY